MTTNDPMPDLDRTRWRGDRHEPTARRIYAGDHLLGKAVMLKVPGVGRGRRPAWRWFVRPASTAWDGDVVDTHRGAPALANLGPYKTWTEVLLGLVEHLRTHRAEGVAVLYGEDAVR